MKTIIFTTILFCAVFFTPQMMRAAVVNAATPTITAQPKGATVSVGAAVTLSVTAFVSDGGALSYQWYHTSSLLMRGTAISGATVNKTATATSNTVMLTVNPVWQIGSPNAADLKATLDASGTLTISGKGAMQDFASDAAPWSSVKDNITALVIQSGVTYIGMYAFDGCSSIKGTLNIPSTVTSIGYSAFGHCYGFTGNLNIPKSVTSISNYAFDGCYGFTGNLNIPKSITTINEGVFRYCKGFGSVTIPDSVTIIRNYAFAWCSGLTGNLTIPNSVTSIGGYAFGFCSNLTGNLTIPNSVVAFAYYAFDGCSGFTGLTIPNSVTFIDVGTFKNCSGLTFINCQNSTPSKITLGGDVFAGVDTTTCVLNVPSGSKTLYHNADQWKAFINIVEPAVAPTITTTSLPNGTVGTAYNQTLQTTGDKPISWSIATGSLPGGLSLATTTGVISGMPTASGTFNFTVKAANATGSGTKALTMTIVAATTYTLSASTLTSFGSKQIPYTQPAAQTVTVTNTGTGSVTLNQPTATNYIIGTLSTTALAAGAKATFTVQPKANLAAGNYNETISISGTGGTSEKVAVSAKVDASFTVAGGTAIETVSQATGLKAWVQNGTLHVSGLTAGKPCRVYTVTGVLVTSPSPSKGGEEVTTSLPGHGLYIVQSGNWTVKVMSEP